MSEDTESKSHAGRWIIAVVGVLVLYVLSWGPVEALGMKYDPTVESGIKIYTFYQPLILCCKKWDKLEDWMGNYRMWWRGILHVPV